MSKYVIKGGIKLDGSIEIDSAKNSVLPMMAGAILTKEIVVIKKCPKITDVFNMSLILKSLGVKTDFIENDLYIDASNLSGYTVNSELTNKLRSSFFMTGALLSAVNKAEVCFPGGCKIGKRPIDLHISALKCLGVCVTETVDRVICTRNGLLGRDVELSFPSVGATENVILSSVFCKGSTVLYNAAREPEISDLADFLNSMGAKISGAGSSTVIIQGVKRLHGTVYTPIPDRIETGTYLLAAAITDGEIELKNTRAENISLLIHKLSNNTCKIRISNDIIYLKCGRVRRNLFLSTGPYPLFPTDLQAQATVLATVSDGVSVVKENVFENRFGYVKWLIKMGADITVFKRAAIINGVKRLHGGTVFAEDLRGGAALVLSGLLAEGKTTVCDIEHIERGYANLVSKLRHLGAEIEKTD